MTTLEQPVEPTKIVVKELRFMGKRTFRVTFLYPDGSDKSVDVQLDRATVRQIGGVNMSDVLTMAVNFIMAPGELLQIVAANGAGVAKVAES